MPSGVYKRSEAQIRALIANVKNPKTRELNSISQLGKKLSEETKKKIFTLERAKKISETHKKLYKEKKILPPFLGKKHLEETKKKMSEKHKREKNPAWKGGLTRLEKREKLAGRSKPDKCEICFQYPKKNQYICFDHDHKTGKFRGWICQNCNAVLGLANDNIDVLNNMIKYLLNQKIIDNVL
ncbi:MAG: endonuclease domain-containing protein [Nanoarchaeota archaeon]